MQTKQKGPPQRAIYVVYNEGHSLSASRRRVMTTYYVYLSLDASAAPRATILPWLEGLLLGAPYPRPWAKTRFYLLCVQLWQMGQTRFAIPFDFMKQLFKTNHKSKSNINGVFSANWGQSAMNSNNTHVWFRFKASCLQSFVIFLLLKNLQLFLKLFEICKLEF